MDGQSSWSNFQPLKLEIKETRYIVVRTKKKDESLRMYDAHKIYDKKIIEYVIFEKEEKYKFFSISNVFEHTKKKKSFG